MPSVREMLDDVADKQDSREPPPKRLAINAPSDEELYSYSTSLRCFSCSSVGEMVHSNEPNVSLQTPVFWVAS